MRPETRVRHLERDLGDLLDHHEGQRSLDEFRKYGVDSLGMAAEVGFEPYPKQIEIADALLTSDRVAVRGANGTGKDGSTVGWIIPWWVYGRGGLVILTGPTQTHVEEICMRKEIA